MFVQVSPRMLVKFLYYAGSRIASPSCYKPGRRWLGPNKWSDGENLWGREIIVVSHSRSTAFKILLKDQLSSLNL